MEKYKNRVFKLLGLLVVVFLVCLCLLGSTFARYTTGVEGTATAEVAEWDVSAASGGLNQTQTVTIGKLSPMLKSDTPTSASYYQGNYKYVNLIYKKVATITVTDIDVNAQLQLSYTGVTVNGAGNTNGTLDSSSYTTDSTGSWSVDSSGITSSNLDVNPLWSQVIGKTLSFNVGYEMYGSNLTSSTASASFTTATYTSWTESTSVSCYGYNISDTGVTSLALDSETTVALSADSVSSGAPVTIDVYAWVTWTSDYSTYDADVVDAIDTWIGKNVASVSATISCKLVQASTLTSNNSN